MDSINRTLLRCSLEYHGSDLLEALKAEQGEEFALAGSSLVALPSSSSFTSDTQCTSAIEQQQPQGFQFSKNAQVLDKCSLRKDMLTRFIAKKADILFHDVPVDALLPEMNEIEYKDHYGIVPPLEYFMDVDQEARKLNFYQSLRKGDVVFGSVFGMHTHGVIIRLLCLAAGRMFYIHDLCLRCFCNVSQIPTRSAHINPLEAFEINDLVQGVVLDVQPLAQKIYISMKDAALPPDKKQNYKLGLITEESLPIHYRECLSAGSKLYGEALEDAHGFANPSTVSHMADMLGFDLSTNHSLMRGLHMNKYPREDYAVQLYKVQCARWAYKSVEEGVRYFKSGNNVEAFQCLNKALQIDPVNVEALVARGALYANNSSFKRALEDFYRALDENPKHPNAIKFTVETLIALAKQYEEQNNTTKVVSCYEKALRLNPSHAEATTRLSAFQEKLQGQQREKARQIALENETANTSNCDTKQRLKQLLSSEKLGRQEHRHTKRKNSVSSSSNTSFNDKSKSGKQHEDTSGDDSDGSRSSDSYRTSRRRKSSLSATKRSKKKRKKSRHKKRSWKKRHRRRRSSSDSSASPLETSLSESTDDGGDRHKTHKKKRSRSTSVRSCDSYRQTLILELPLPIEPRIGPCASQEIPSSSKPTVVDYATDTPTTSIAAVGVIDSDQPNCSTELQGNNDESFETSNGNRDEIVVGVAAEVSGDGQSLEELESFLAALKAQQTIKRIK